MAAGAVGILALAGCEPGLTFGPDVVLPGDEVTVSNTDRPCLPDEAAEVAVVWGDEDAFLELVPVQSDGDGIFSLVVPGPDRPGQHLAIAACESMDLEADEGIAGMLLVSQPPLSLGLDRDEVAVGEPVVATFSACQNENDFGFLGDGEIDDEAPELVRDLAADMPDLDVYLDGELVETVEGTDRYPTEPINVALTLTEPGEHEVRGVCRYQTFRLDLDLLLGELEEVLEVAAAGASAAAVDYPVDFFLDIVGEPEGAGVLVFDTAEVESPVAAFTVVAPTPVTVPPETPVTQPAAPPAPAPAPAPAAPVAQAQPTFAG